jgi:hypothetical protein
MRPVSILRLLILVPATLAPAQKQKPDSRSGYDRSAKAVLLHPANVYVAPDDSSQRAALVGPGHEVVIAERSGPWVRVFANTDVKDKVDDRDEPEFADDDPTPASGWIRDKGIVTPTSPNGDRILYGAAANYEAAAAQPHAPADAATAAHLLYRRVATYFPQSPLAPEAAWRSADIRWQIDKRDQATLPSAKEQDPSLRPGMYEGELKTVIKLFPGSPQAAKAAFELLDNKLCGDWQGLPKCPEQETALYEKYAEKNPAGPRTAEALYEATFRQGSLVTMYEVEENHKKALNAAAHTQSLAQQIQAKFPESDFAARAQAIAYRVQQGIPIYGNDRD